MVSKRIDIYDEILIAEIQSNNTTTHTSTTYSNADEYRLTYVPNIRFWFYFQLIYQNCVLTYSDMDYVEACVKNVLNNLYQDSTGSLVLGSVAIPTPPANVGKEFYYKEPTLLHCIFILLNFSVQIDGNRPKRKNGIYISLYFASFYFKILQTLDSGMKIMWMMNSH